MPLQLETEMCDYQGYEFGAGRYPDSYCIDGKLHDADSDFLKDEDIPCPICRPQDAIAWWAERNELFWDDDEDMDDEEGHKRRALASATSLVNDIRANRGLVAAA
jgi:hypothetical protein